MATATASRGRRTSTTISPSEARLRRRDETWLLELTSTPTAAGREERVMAWLDGWLRPRAKKLRVRRDDAGNYLVTRRDARTGGAPLLITAHLDHPAFVVLDGEDAVAPRGSVWLEFRGGVHNPYFLGAAIEIIDAVGARHEAVIMRLEPDAKPYKRVLARLSTPSARRAIVAGDIGRWRFPPPRILMRDLPGPNGSMRSVRVLETHACDDLAAVAAACAAFERMLAKSEFRDVGLLFTVAEEVGFIGAIHAAKRRFIPRKARLLCLENSRSFPHDSPIGAGAIVRVGDRLSVFSPSLTNTISDLLISHAKKTPTFRWQRKLMPGGACEATAFAAFGYESTCLCLPLGNYHNMTAIDETLAAAARNLRTRGAVAPEFIALDDFHSLVEMLLVAARGLCMARTGSHTARAHRMLMERIYTKGCGVLAG